MRKRKTSFNLVIGGLLVGFFFLMLIVSFFYTPFAVNEMHTTERFLPPGKPYLLGTDNFGRDIFSRIMKGTQTAFLVGAISVLIGLVIGVCLGALSGYFGAGSTGLLRTKCNNPGLSWCAAGLNDCRCLRTGNHQYNRRSEYYRDSRVYPELPGADFCSLRSIAL